MLVKCSCLVNLLIDELDKVISVKFLFFRVLSVGLMLVWGGNVVIYFLMVCFVFDWLILMFLLCVIMIKVVVFILIKLWNWFDVMFMREWWSKVVNYKLIKVLLLFNIGVSFCFILFILSNVLLILKISILGNVIYCFMFLLVSLRG